MTITIARGSPSTFPAAFGIRIIIANISSLYGTTVHHYLWQENANYGENTFTLFQRDDHCLWSATKTKGLRARVLTVKDELLKVNTFRKPEMSRLPSAFKMGEDGRVEESRKVELTCGLSGDEPEGGAEEVEGTDEHVQEREGKADFARV